MHTLENAVLGWICKKRMWTKSGRDNGNGRSCAELTIRVIFARNLEECRESLVIPIDNGANLVCNMLVDEENGNVFSLVCVLVECLFDICHRCLLSRDHEDMSGPGTH